MTYHDLVVDDVTEWQMAEKNRKQIVRFYIIFGFDLALKAIHFIELFRLMVPSAHEEVLGEAHLPRQHQHDHLDRERASIDEITVEDVWILL